MAVITVTKANFETDVLKSADTVLLDFWATWCGPCRMLAPVIEELAAEYEGRAKVGKVNVDEQAALAIRYNVSVIPTVLLFKDGKVVETSVGVKPKSAFEALLT